MDRVDPEVTVICYHGHDNPKYCSQCPKEPQDTRRRLDELMPLVRSDSRDTFRAALSQHDRAHQEAGARESERFQKFIRELREQLAEAQERATNFDGRAIMQKLKEIESKLR